MSPKKNRKREQPENGVQLIDALLRGNPGAKRDPDAASAVGVRSAYNMSRLAPEDAVAACLIANTLLNTSLVLHLGEVATRELWERAREADRRARAAAAQTPAGPPDSAEQEAADAITFEVSK